MKNDTQKLRTIISILEDQHGVITSIDDNGMCVFKSPLYNRSRVTPAYSFHIMDNISVNEWVKEINKSLINFVEMAKLYGVVIRQWPEVKFGHNQVVTCEKPYEPDPEYHGGSMVELYHDSNSHFIVGKEYTIIEAYHTHQVYITNELGHTFWYNEDYFEPVLEKNKLNHQ